MFVRRLKVVLKRGAQLMAAGLGGAEGPFLVPEAFVLVRRFDEEQRLRRAYRRLRALLAPAATIGQRLDREALVELPQRDVLGARRVRFGESIGGDLGLPIGDE